MTPSSYYLSGWIDEVSSHTERRSIFTFAPRCLIWITLACVGCQGPHGQMQGKAPRAGDLLAGGQRIIGTTVQGRSIEAWFLGDGPDCVMILASIHGDEDAGTPLLGRLRSYLSTHSDLLDGRRIVLVPATNPDGVAGRMRTNAHGVDLNRNFPSSNYLRTDHHGEAALSEPESAAIHSLMESERPRRIVSIHQPLRSGHACIDYDGPAAGLAQAMAARGDLPVEKLGGQPGSLGSYAGLTLGIPIITLELPKGAGQLNEQTLWQHFGEMLLAAIVYPAN